MVPTPVTVPCKAEKAETITPPSVVDQGEVNRKHMELAIKYNEQASKHDAYVDCVEAWNSEASSSSDKTKR